MNDFVKSIGALQIVTSFRGDALQILNVTGDGSVKEIAVIRGTSLEDTLGAILLSKSAKMYTLLTTMCKEANKEMDFDYEGFDCGKYKPGDDGVCVNAKSGYCRVWNLIAGGNL